MPLSPLVLQFCLEAMAAGFLRDPTDAVQCALTGFLGLKAKLHKQKRSLGPKKVLHGLAESLGPESSPACTVNAIVSPRLLFVGVDQGYGGSLGSGVVWGLVVMTQMKGCEHRSDGCGQGASPEGVGAKGRALTLRSMSLMPTGSWLAEALPELWQ